MKLRSQLLLLALFSNGAFAQSQDGPLEEITVIGELSRYSATKSDTPILETARSLSVEDRQSLLDFGAVELADAYTYSAGVAGEAFGFSTRGDWVRVRGLDVPQYQDSLQSLFGNYNNTRPEVYTLEQVEILKGPASVLYGQGSPGGIVNTVSKRPNADASNELVVSFGNFNYQQIAADVNGQLDSQGHWLYRLIGLARESETQVQFVENNARVIAPSISYQPSDDTEVTLLLSYQDSKADAGAQFLPIAGTLIAAPNGEFIASDFNAGDPEFSYYDGTTESVTLLANHQLNDVWSTEFTARRTTGDRDYEQAWIALGFSADRYVRNADGSLYGGGLVPRSFYQAAAESEQNAVDLRFRADFDTGAVNHQLMIGGQYQDVTTNDSSAYAYALGYDFASAGPDAILGDRYWINVFAPQYGDVPSQDILDQYFYDAPASNVKDRGLYINNQMQVGNLHWNIGVRRDDVTNVTVGADVRQKDSSTSIASGLLYAFDSGVSPYLSYAESFQPVVGLDAVTGTPFQAQDGEQIEAGVKVQLPDNIGYITVAYFDIEQSNLLTSTPTGSTQAGGIDSVSGWELEAKFSLGKFEIETNLSQLDTQTQDGYRFTTVPEDQASSWVTYNPGNGFRAGLGARYTGESFDGVDTIETPSYTLIDAMLAYQMEHWVWRVNARNLADEEYQSTCISRGDCFQGERRSVIGSISYQF
ncbi:TonB-dependent siderophore receptor [Arenicella xantha]|uniref:Iron complex outermembrane receptor protein n=1 Tax=Arenicella xantha TaxID=644221 RepID=A0A395JM15_9GAMM|nr:TonB-dependent siderophore receptor [Arenicella xantha]RBP50654.1 iron complex outermembrane receptor protein [Arenicella xantha]